MKTILSMVPMALLLCGDVLTAAEPAAINLFERGVYLEQTKGDLPGAIDAYERFIENQRANRLFVARAHYRLGLCYLQQGQKSKAVDAFKTLINDYPDHPELAEQARRRMPLLFDETIEQIEEHYFESVDHRALMETAIRAMVGQLDSSSDYLDHATLKEYQRLSENELSGIGAALRFDADTREIVVTKPLFGSPAAAAGVQPGDRILEIDGRAIEGLPAGEEMKRAVEQIRGPAGEPVTLTLRRDQERMRLRIVRGPVRLELVRGTFRQPDGTWNFVADPSGPTGYLRIAHFAKGTTAEVRGAMESLRRQDVPGLVLDLRGNPGGLLEEALAVADLFIADGVLLTSKGRNQDRTWRASRDGTFADMKLVVLVDHATASASEVVASALQDHERAVVVGERTFGMGLIKSLIPLEGGESALKLPIATYYRANGGNIHRHLDDTEDDEWGVRPSEGFAMVVSDKVKEEAARFWDRQEQAANFNAEDLPDPVCQTAFLYLKTK